MKAIVSGPQPAASCAVLDAPWSNSSRSTACVDPCVQCPCTICIAADLESELLQCKQRLSTERARNEAARLRIALLQAAISVGHALGECFGSPGTPGPEPLEAGDHDGNPSPSRTRSTQPALSNHCHTIATCIPSPNSLLLTMPQPSTSLCPLPHNAIAAVLKLDESSSELAHALSDSGTGRTNVTDASHASPLARYCTSLSGDTNDEDTDRVDGVGTGSGSFRGGLGSDYATGRNESGSRSGRHGAGAVSSGQSSDSRPSSSDARGGTGAAQGTETGTSSIGSMPEEELEAAVVAEDAPPVPLEYVHGGVGIPSSSFIER